MSIHQNLYVGPYARWLVKTRVDDDALSELLRSQDDVLFWNAGGLAGEPPEVIVNGEQYRCYSFIPDIERPGQPEREMWFSGGVSAVEDWTDVARKLEMDWFATAFASQLGALADFFGTPPTVRWGMVAWLS